ncbi:SIR2 family protein [Candidatus Uabimicrobium sp. HlEnr_7]|uniref:SIR2 family protein n=1 Tax=Candidatus Uabimicrobium helgolandensis TaxID=3095367 RepID=UPI003557A8C9
MQPLVIRADISMIRVDVVVYGVGCFLVPGYLAASLKKRYGKGFHEYLRHKFAVASSKNLPNREKRTAENTDIVGNGGLEQGFTSYIPGRELCEEANVPDMVLGVVGGEYRGHINRDSIAQLIANIGKTLSENYPPNRTIRVAFPAFGLGKGRSQRIEVLSAQLKAMQILGENYPNIQPIFISYSDTVHGMALMIQNQASQDIKSFVTKYKMHKHIDELQNELANERLVVFAGAGISQGSGLPSWQELVTSLAEIAGINQKAENVEELMSIAQECRDRLGKSFSKEFKRLLKNSEFVPSITHYLLATLPVSTVVTTNFDSLLEQSLLRIKKVAFTINRAFDVAWAPIKDQVNVLKIHGDIDDLGNITFSKDDYEHYFERRPSLSALLKGLFLNRTFLFVGYSLRDPNLKIILEEVANLLKKAQRPIYMIVFEASEQEILNYKEQGVIIICVSGKTNDEKTTALWKLLDKLQYIGFRPHNTWLAKDANELNLDLKWQADINNLRDVLDTFLSKLDQQESLSDSVIDFLFPWLTLATNNGLSISSELWEKIARHYRERDSQIESIKLNALAAEIAAFRSSDGKRQQRHEARIWEMRKNWHK